MIYYYDNIDNEMENAARVETNEKESLKTPLCYDVIMHS